MATTLTQASSYILARNSASNLKTVYAMFNGQKIPVTYDQTSDQWVLETVAPAVSSWSQPNHVYTISLYAEDLAGNIVTIDSTDPTYGRNLQIRVLETTKPIVTIVSPTQGAVLGSSDVDVVVDLTDNGGSGLDMSTFTLSINGNAVRNDDISWEEAENSHTVGVYQALSMSDGVNQISADISDFDGNTSVTAQTNFSISTVAPTLEVTKPGEDLITNVSPIHISGRALPGTNAVTLQDVTVNDVVVPIDQDGYFEYDYYFQSEGETVLEIVATDTIGKSTIVVRRIVYDTTLPIISDIVAEEVVVTAGSMIRVTFRVEDPGDQRDY